VDRFWLYWFSASVSYLGDGVRFAALPLLAAALSPQPADVAAVAVAVGLPWLVFGLFAGVLVDRLPRLPLMCIMQLARTILTFAIAGLVATYSMSIPLLMAAVFVLSSCEVVYDVASHAALPQIVERERIQSANSRLMTAEVATFEFIGPVLGAALFSISVVVPFTVDAATFAVSTFCLLLLVRRGPQTQRAALTNGTGASIRQEFLEGIRWFASQRFVRSLTLVGAAVNLGLACFYAMLVLLAQNELGLGPMGYGLLIATGAVGALGAGLISDRLVSDTVRGRICLLSGPVIAVCLLVTAWSDNVSVTAAAILVFCGVVMIFNVVAMSLRQLVTPDELLGRVLSVHRFLCWGAIPAGAALAGLIGEILGVRAAVAAGGIAILLIFISVLPTLTRAAALGEQDIVATP
jgi:MFS family permease